LKTNEHTGYTNMKGNPILAACYLYMVSAQIRLCISATLIFLVSHNKDYLLKSALFSSRMQQ